MEIESESIIRDGRDLSIISYVTYVNSLTIRQEGEFSVDLNFEKKTTDFIVQTTRASRIVIKVGFSIRITLFSLTSDKQQY